MFRCNGAVGPRMAHLIHGCCCTGGTPAVPVKGEGTEPFADDGGVIDEASLNPSIVDTLPVLPGRSRAADGCCNATSASPGNGADADYIGQWRGRLYHGKGKLVQKDGGIYEGDFVDGKAHGVGKYVAANGNVYEGEWVEDMAHGTGRFASFDGNTYEGEWCKDETTGQGQIWWSDGSSYSGQFLQGKKHGQGKFQSPICSVNYEGQFIGDLMHGQGTYNYGDGRCYVGQWLNGKMHGKGTYSYDGAVHRGLYRQGQRHGEGILTWPDGREYKGQWAAGKEDGIGTFKTADGVIVEGIWKQGERLKENGQKS
eukprot:TRINITY_DN83309_c0_g1_i1.p1 TRINITY_DN83309_c0_g1~~TRINITY_DN83309_c0_g1_i1.p1  ORF type:complete len:312 (-),score=53.26 TRINITY_DN83309_c0_g1_i1:60-995(-)